MSVDANDRTLFENRTATLLITKERGECGPGQVPPPTIEALSPSGQRLAARTERVSAGNGNDDLVYIEVQFAEAGITELRLRYTDTHLNIMHALVMVDRTAIAPDIVIEDILCRRRLWVGASGAVGCSESREGPGVDAGTPGFLAFEGGLLVANGQRLKTFADGTRLHPASGTVFWLTTPDGGVERYVDRTPALPELNPPAAVELGPEVYAIAPTESDAWVLTHDALHWITIEDGGLSVSQSRPLPGEMERYSALVREGDMVFVANTRGQQRDASEICGYFLTPAGGIEPLPEPCFTRPDFVFAGDGKRVWFGIGGNLTMYGLDVEQRRLVVQGVLATPWAPTNDPRDFRHVPYWPSFGGAIPRLLGDGGIVLEAYPTWNFLGIDASETLVWEAKTTSETGRPRTVIYRREP